MKAKVMWSIGIILTALCASLILLFSLENGSSVPSVSWIPFADKGAHALAYAALGFSVALWALQGKRRFRFPLCLVVLVAFGGCIELLQPEFGRAKELLDFLSDGIGSLVGLLFGMSFLFSLDRWWKRRYGKGNETPRN